jgi:dTDP-4-dehydrorhamnose 3,5-epimerase
MMSAAHTKIEGLELLQPSVFEDERGHFLERWNQSRFNDLVGSEVSFVQDNQSRSRRGVLRGLHYQVSPSAQGKLVSCIAGAVFDVAVDIRRSSATFGQWFGIELSADNRSQLWIPVGFAHGFLALTDGAELLYKTTDYYDPAAERSILWDDPEIGIEWPVGGEPPLVSPKDALAKPLADAEVFA